MDNRVIGAAVAILVIGASYLALVACGTRLWANRTRRLEQALDRSRRPARGERYSTRELDRLPPPVQRYLRLVLPENGRIVTGATIRQAGTFDVAGTGHSWKPFRATQSVAIMRCGFVWNARIAVLPGLPIFVHDAYIAAEGHLHASAIGLRTIAEQRGSPELGRGELMRFLAESAWYPSVLLPGEVTRWEPIDAECARVSINDGAIRAMLEVRFGADGLIQSMYAAERGRLSGGRIELTPWQVHWSNYREYTGMCIPTQGVVEWLLPEGPRPYLRGSLTAIDYEFARGDL